MLNVFDCRKNATRPNWWHHMYRVSWPRNRSRDDVVITNMIHEPCSASNPQSPCMVDGKCSQHCPRNLTDGTITDNDGYPLCQRRPSEDGGRTTTVNMKGNYFVVDNTWIVPYSPLLSKNLRRIVTWTIQWSSSMNSVKHPKYIYKYVTKGNDIGGSSKSCSRWWNYVLSNWSISDCSTFDNTSGEQSTSLFHYRKCCSTCSKSTSDNIGQFLLNLPKWSIYLLY